VLLALVEISLSQGHLEFVFVKFNDVTHMDIGVMVLVNGFEKLEKIVFFFTVELKFKQVEQNLTLELVSEKEVLHRL